MTIDDLHEAATSRKPITATVDGIVYVWPAGGWDVVPGVDAYLVRQADGRDTEHVLFLAELDHLVVTA